MISPSATCTMKYEIGITTKLGFRASVGKAGKLYLQVSFVWWQTVINFISNSLIKWNCSDDLGLPYYRNSDGV